MSQERVIIIGAGWAGLSAATYLTKHGYPVTLLDAAPKPGGRARGLSFGQYRIDNGQHLFIGAYKHVFELLELIGLNPKPLFHRCRMQLVFKYFSTQEKLDTLTIKARHMVAPLHLAFGLLFAKGLSAKEKFQALFFCYRMKLNHFTLSEHLTVFDLLKTYKQSPNLIKKLWEPIALAALSTPIHQASAQLFLTVLKDSFNHKRTDCDWLFPKVPLSEIIPMPCIEWLKKHNATFYPNTRAIDITNDGTNYTIHSRSEIYTGQHVVFACPPHEVKRILNKKLPYQLDKQLNSFTYERIVTIYLIFEEAITLEYPMIGTDAPHIQWVFHHSFSDQSNMLAVVHTGFGLSHLKSHEIIDIVRHELKTYLDIHQNIQSYKIIQEKRAAFSATPKSDMNRPEQRTSIPNIWLAGDYTKTPYPATMEGAILSGKNCANALINHQKNNS